MGTYVCAKNLVLAHAKAYHAYNDLFKPSQRGICGITLSVNWVGPLTDTEEDLYAAELGRQASVSLELFNCFVYSIGLNQMVPPLWRSIAPT